MIFFLLKKTAFSEFELFNYILLNEKHQQSKINEPEN